VDRADVESAIRSAFAGVQLGSGVSLGQAEAIDRLIFPIKTPDFDLLPLAEVSDDWAQVPEEELRRDNIAHMDGEALRYYLPAFMLWLLDHYDDQDLIFDDGASMAVIGTIGAIASPAEFAQSHDAIFDRWFTDEQRRAIAAFVAALPALVHLRHEDEMFVSSALDRYWSRFLPTS
jgi:hypothetical protein